VLSAAWEAPEKLLSLAAKNRHSGRVPVLQPPTSKALPRVRVAGRKSAPGNFFRLSGDRVRKVPRKSLGSRRVEEVAATKSASGVRYYGNRYYSPSLGRFINKDPIAEAGGLNLYGFCGNDGVNRFDVLGHGFWDWLFGSGSGEGGSEEKAAERRENEEAQRKTEENAKQAAIDQYGFLGAFALQMGAGAIHALGEAAYESSTTVSVSQAAAFFETGATSFSINPSSGVIHIDDRTVIDENGQKWVYRDKYTSTGSRGNWYHDGGPNNTVGAPGTLESFIPIWGSGRAAVDDFQNGRWGWGTFNAVMAVSDVFLLKTAATMAGKGLWKAGSATWGATRKWLGKQGYAEAGQHVHHGIVAQEVYRGTAWEKVFNQPWNLKPLEPPPGISMDAWHKMVEGKLPGLNGAERWWYGTPDWFRFTQISELLIPYVK
jgi:RHS repeat-associated protein